MTTNIIFVGATPINLWKVHMPVSFFFAYAHPKSISYCHYENKGNSLMTACAPTINESQWKDERAITFCFQFCQHFRECFKQKDSVKQTSAITAVSKSYKKP